MADITVNRVDLFSNDPKKIVVIKYKDMGDGTFAEIISSSGSGGGGGGGAITAADGADVTQGAIADAAVTAGSTGTVSGKLRQISGDIATIKSSTPALGQAAMVASSPVVIANNQSAIAVVNTDPTTTDKAKVSATQRLRVQQDGTQVFYEAWDAGTIETTYNWNTAVTSAGATSTPTAGQEVLATGVTANSYAYLRSKNTFQPSSPGYIETDHQVAVTAPVTHGYAFWGVGIPATTPTAAAYAQDAIGFEVTAAGAFNAVTWAGSTKNIIAVLTLPGDVNVHRYQVYMRGDSIYWLQDNVTVANIQTGALGPNTNLLPVLMLVGNDASGSTGFSLTSAAVYLGDSSKAGFHITDPTHPQLGATVTTTNALKVDGSAVNQPVSGTNSNLYTGQATSNGTTPIQLSAVSHTLTNGVIVKSLSGNNSAGVYVGLTGVAITTGDLLEPGESRGYPVSNTNLLYIVTASSTTDVVTFSGN